MGTLFAARVEVWTCSGRPVRFLWRGRLYVVRRIVEHWVTLPAVWDSTEPEQPAATQSPHRDTALRRREYWRVHAGTGPAPGAYELRYDSHTQEWLLTRVWD
ncbi:DUF6504 family protein [Lipingzhangella sp. LS1_29]|uniref:DUF6504 family protein n=1 Tax=Lipingzhangella rawalii TaxID=2055835 RepID=A0ABU2H705_9ACTN|nr:DUF6504 family protein [Lipingzhangella rawalii]MDS1271071.1 DUF6504 family protein [Lipingzhangella rawalii]